MDFNKIAARVAVELKSAGYLAEFIQSALSILSEAGAIPASANNPRLATALEVVLQSELFDVLLLRLLHDRKPPNVPGSGTSSWAGNFGSAPVRPPGDSPKSISGLWKYYPGKYQCVRLVPTNVCKWRLIEVYRDLFYFSDDCAIRAGIGIAQNTGLPFILGLKHNKTASKSDLLLLNPTEFD